MHITKTTKFVSVFCYHIHFKIIPRFIILVGLNITYKENIMLYYVAFINGDAEISLKNS